MKIVLPDIGMEIKSCRLANGGKVRLTKQDKSYLIEFTGAVLPQIDTIVEIEVAGNVMGIEPVEISAQSLSYNKKVSASSNPDPSLERNHFHQQW